MIKYEISAYRFSMSAFIKPIEVERETEVSIWVNGKRRAKISEYEKYYDTRKEAKIALLKDAEIKINKTKDTLSRYEDYLRQIIDL